MEEIWKPVEGFDYYEVSNTGKVRSLTHYNERSQRTYDGKVLQQFLDTSGYPSVTLWDDGRKVSASVHRLVAEAFIPNPEGLP